jgi:hypothetical protein
MRLIALLLSLASTAAANTIFVLDQDGCTGSCGLGPFATITLTQSAPGTVTVFETLAHHMLFAGTGAGEALSFSVLGAPVIGNLTSGFAIGPANVKASTFGEFSFSISCTACRGGQLTNPPGPLSFTLSSPTGFHLSDFVSNDLGYYFASDIRGSNGNTGNVATGEAQSVPEPAPFVLVGAGLVGFSLFRQRRAS